MTTRPDQVTQANEYHAKTTVPSAWGKTLSHIAADLGLSKQELLREAVALLLRFHGHAAPEPTPPVTMTPATTEVTP